MGNEIKAKTNLERLKEGKRLIRCCDCKHGNCYTGDDYKMRVNCGLYPISGLPHNHFCAAGEARHSEAHT